MDKQYLDYRMVFVQIFSKNGSTIDKINAENEALKRQLKELIRV